MKNVLAFNWLKEPTVEDHNSTNDWGFGGWVGKKYNYSDRVYFEDGYWYYRHIGRSLQKGFKVDGYTLGNPAKGQTSIAVIKFIGKGLQELAYLHHEWFNPIDKEITEIVSKVEKKAEKILSTEIIDLSKQ